jgi:hypothetical protein
MIDYTQWKRRIANVSSLMLDPENPRIPPTEEDLPQDELIAELIEHDRVYDLAKQIATKGYYTDESLITAPRDGRMVVVEGNRRLAALKALLSPTAVPQEHREKFRALSVKIPKLMIKSVPVTVAPSRDATLPRIAEKHTRPLLEQWKPAQQARFYRSLLEHGKPVEDICANYGLTEGQLYEFLRMDVLYQMACSLDLPKDVQRKVENPRKFPITNLERFMESQPGRDFLCVEPDAEHVFKGHISASEFKKGFARVVTDVAEGSVTSRNLNDSQSIKRYLKKIKVHEPDKRKKGSFKSKDIIKKPEKSMATIPAKQKRTRARRSATTLIPSDLKCGVDNQRIHDVFNELRRLKVAKFTNAAAIMVRVLLELSVSHFIQQSHRTQDLLKKYNKNQQRPADWHPSLRQQLNFMIDEMSLPLEPLELKALKTFSQQRQTPMTLDTLDGFVHNKNMQPTETDLRAALAKIEPLLRIVLIEPRQTKN